MADDDQHIDGNGIAGLLAEAFGADVTAAPRRCVDCGLTSVLGAHRVHRGAGIVVRCPGCDAVALRIGEVDDRLMVTWSGVLSLPRASR